MQVIDLILMSFFVLILEKIILKEKYILLSPFTLTILSFLFVYVMPLFLMFSGYTENIISNSTPNEISKLLLYIRLFFYPLSIFSILSFIKIRKMNLMNKRPKSTLRKEFVLFISILSITVIILTQLIIVRFNLPIFFDKLINPRLYTYFKEGIGPLTYLVEIFKKLFLFVSIIYFHQKKSILSLSLMSIAGLLNILGGTKTNIIVILIFYLLIWQKFSIRPVRINFAKIGRYGIILSSTLVIAFMIMSTTNETIKSSINSIFTYSQEAYYTSKVLSDFEPEFDHVKTLIEGFIFTPIPRAIYEGKNYYGFYSNYWRPMYQPNTVIYHSSTYGILAEGQMILGIFSTLIYSLIFVGMLQKIYRKYYSSNNLVSIFFWFFLISQIYFIMRVGFFESTLLWSIILHYLGARFLLNQKIKL